MRLFRVILTITLFLVTQVQLLAQTPYDGGKKFEVKQLQEDFKALRKVLEEIHPGLYRYSSKKTIDSLFNSSYSQIISPMTEIELYRIINKIVTAIRDEHTFTLPSKGIGIRKLDKRYMTTQLMAAMRYYFLFLLK